MREVVLGDTSEESTDIGPLISTAQQEKVAAMVERAVADGAKIACGGSIPQSPGSFYTPDLVTDAAQDSEIVQKRSSPVLVAPALRRRRRGGHPFGQRHAVRLGRVGVDHRCGARHRASREIQAGCVWINDHIPIVSGCPTAASNNPASARDMSSWNNFEGYTQIKHVSMDITGSVTKDWHRTIFRRERAGVSAQTILNR